MKQQRHFIVDILFVLTLFGVFTVSALMLVTIGAEVYRHTIEDMDSNFETRTAVSYITEKVRQNDTIIANTNISVSTLSGEPALMLTQDVNNEAYCTYLYLYEGYLKELFMKSGSYLGEDTLAAGQNIMELSDFTLKQIDHNLISIQLTTAEGESHNIFISTHCTP